jgi:serine protease Do
MSSLKRLLFAKANNLVVILLSVALGFALASNWSRPNSLYAVDPQTTTAAQKATLKQIEDGFTTIAEKAEPTVVTIEARANPKAADENPRVQQRRRPQPDDENGNPFGDLPDFFRRFGAPDTAPSRSGGSGVIVRTDGRNAYVLTNFHVVRNRDRFTVTLQDKTDHPATLVGQDEMTDLAVLKVETSRPLPPQYVASLGDSDRVRVGQWAIAIGSPLSYDQTLTVGVISAKGRTLYGGGGGGGRSQYSDLIQTDAAINPGNSGGPGEHRRRGRGDQRGDRRDGRHGGQHRHRLRDPGQYRQDDPDAAHRQREGDPRLAGRRDDRAEPRADAGIEGALRRRGRGADR